MSTGTLPASHSRATGSGSFRPDIEGLLAIAVILVILYHAGMRLMQGGYVGVNVFFVISGFLIIGLIVREIERDRKADLLRFSNRRMHIWAT